MIQIRQSLLDRPLNVVALALLVAFVAQVTGTQGHLHARQIHTMRQCVYGVRQIYTRSVASIAFIVAECLDSLQRPLALIVRVGEKMSLRLRPIRALLFYAGSHGCQKRGALECDHAGSLNQPDEREPRSRREFGVHLA